MTKLEVLELLHELIWSCNVVVSDEWGSQLVVDYTEVQNRIKLAIHEEKSNANP